MNKCKVTFCNGFHQYIMLEMSIITLSLSTLSDYNCVHICIGFIVTMKTIKMASVANT